MVSPHWTLRKTFVVSEVVSSSAHVLTPDQLKSHLICNVNGDTHTKKNKTKTNQISPKNFKWALKPIVWTPSIRQTTLPLRGQNAQEELVFIIVFSNCYYCSIIWFTLKLIYHVVLSSNIFTFQRILLYSKFKDTKDLWTFLSSKYTIPHDLGRKTILNVPV